MKKGIIFGLLIMLVILFGLIIFLAGLSDEDMPGLARRYFCAIFILVTYLALILLSWNKAKKKTEKGFVGTPTDDPPDRGKFVMRFQSKYGGRLHLLLERSDGGENDFLYCAFIEGQLLDAATKKELSEIPEGKGLFTIIKGTRATIVQKGQFLKQGETEKAYYLRFEG